MMANRSDRRLLTLRCVRALEAVGMSTRTRRADFHQGQGSFATPISQAGYMTATRFPLSVPHPCTRAGSIYDTTLRRHLKRNLLAARRNSELVDQDDTEWHQAPFGSLARVSWEEGGPDQKKVGARSGT